MEGGREQQQHPLEGTLVRQPAGRRVMLRKEVPVGACPFDAPKNCGEAVLVHGVCNLHMTTSGRCQLLKAGRETGAGICAYRVLMCHGHKVPVALHRQSAMSVFERHADAVLRSTIQQ